MAISSTKLIKVGGPVLTGIGGVIATSSLVSKNADEKSEEKLKTVALRDEEPPIDPYKDQNEGKSGESSGDQQSESSSDSDPSGGEQGGGETEESGEKSKGDEGSQSDGEKQGDAGTETQEQDGKGMENLESSTENESSLGTSEGSVNAENVNVEGTAYGRTDRAMTSQELERTKTTLNSLKDLQSELKQLIA